MNSVQRLKCWWQHKWAFDGGHWITKDVSITTRICVRCGLKQDIEHYHIIANYTPGELGHGISALHAERRPGDDNYHEKFKMNERPT